MHLSLSKPDPANLPRRLCPSTYAATATFTCLPGVHCSRVRNPIIRLTFNPSSVKFCTVIFFWKVSRETPLQHTGVQGSTGGGGKVGHGVP